MSYASDMATGVGADMTFDPERHDNQIVSVYESVVQARAARDQLIAAGIPAGAIEIVQGAEQAAPDPSEGSFWSALKSLFAPASDLHDYHHALGRGHAMVAVTPGVGMDRQQVMDLLERTDAIDFDSRVAGWQAGGSADAGRSMADTDGLSTPSLMAGTPEGNMAGSAGSHQPAAGAFTEASAAAAGTTSPGLAGAGMSAPDGASGRTAAVTAPRSGVREAGQGGGRFRSYLAERAGGAEGPDRALGD